MIPNYASRFITAAKRFDAIMELKADDAKIRDKTIACLAAELQRLWEEVELSPSGYLSLAIGDEPEEIAEVLLLEAESRGFRAVNTYSTYFPLQDYAEAKANERPPLLFAKGELFRLRDFDRIGIWELPDPSAYPSAEAIERLGAITRLICMQPEQRWAYLKKHPELCPLLPADLDMEAEPEAIVLHLRRQTSIVLDIALEMKAPIIAILPNMYDADYYEQTRRVIKSGGLVLCANPYKRTEPQWQTQRTDLVMLWLCNKVYTLGQEQYLQS